MQTPGVLWFTVYLVAVLAPSVVALITDPFTEPRQTIVELSAAIGLVAFAVIAMQFALVSRFQASSRPFGTDALVQFHQYLGGVALALALLHPFLLNGAGLPWAAWNPLRGSLAMRSGVLGVLALLLLVATTVWRRRLRLSYEAWQSLHLALAVLAAGSMVVHALSQNGYSRTTPVRLTLLAYAATFGLITLHYRIVRPWRLARRPWEVVANIDAGGSTRLLRLRPIGHAGLRFEPGQFAWLLTGRTPLSSEQHPLSIASSAVPSPDGSIEFSIKALGDWSRDIAATLSQGTRVWVDGAFGAFTTERKSNPGFVMIAGGIGLAPIRSMLLTMRDRGDRRHVVLFIAASDESRLILRDEIEPLRASLNLEIVMALECPPPAWTGERGYIGPDTLRRHLPIDFKQYHYFVCGPPPMLDAVESALRVLDVPEHSIESERFNLV